MAAWVVVALWVSGNCSAVPPAASRSGTELEAPPAVHIRIDQDGRLSPQDLRIVIEEIANIWGAAGVRVTSGRYADPVPAGRALISLRIVGEQWQRGGRTVLGWVTPDVHEQQTPTIFISHSGVRALLARAQFRGRAFTLQPVILRDRLTAQAIGRVAAHELGHYFLQSTHHQERGLMRANYMTTDLVAPSLKPFEIPATGWVALRIEVARLAEAQTR